MRYIFEEMERRCIDIIDVPPGEAPEWVRKEWVGLRLPISNDQETKGLVQIGVLGGESQHRGGYRIDTAEAITALRGVSPEAAGWWETNVALDFIKCLTFKKDVCRISLEDST